MFAGHVVFAAGRAFRCDRLGLRRRLSCRKGLSETRATVQDVTNMSVSQAINFLTLVQQLKTTKRTGWVRKGVQGPESIADHMYRMGIMALIAGQPGLDSIKCAIPRARFRSVGLLWILKYAKTRRCLKMALVHDLPEAIVGDITPHDGYSKDEKFRLEFEAMQQIKRILGANPAGAEIESLWLEYEEGATKEAQLVKDFDKLEMILQAQEYEEQQKLDLQEFFDSTHGKFKSAVGQAWAEEIIRRRGTANGDLLP